MALTDNTAAQRFEITVEDTIVFATYRREGETLYIDYVESPPALRGKGAAGQLMQEITALAKAEKLVIVPICGYAAAWLRRHRP